MYGPDPAVSAPLAGSATPAGFHYPILTSSRRAGCGTKQGDLPSWSARVWSTTGQTTTSCIVFISPSLPPSPSTAAVLFHTAACRSPVLRWQDQHRWFLRPDSTWPKDVHGHYVLQTIRPVIRCPSPAAPPLLLLASQALRKAALRRHITFFRRGRPPVRPTNFQPNRYARRSPPLLLLFRSLRVLLRSRAAAAVRSARSLRGCRRTARIRHFSSAAAAAKREKRQNSGRIH